MSEVSPDKPCPFCGNSAAQTTVDDGCHWSSCPKCSATGPTEFLRGDEDSPGWNTRPDFDRVTAERDALQALLTAADERVDVLEGLAADVVECLWGIELPGAGNARLRKLRAALKPAEGGGDAARLALRPENQRITPVRFKCIACGEYHEGSGNLPCPSMSPYSRIEQ